MPPVNDDRANATALGSLDFVVSGDTNVGATVEAGENQPVSWFEATIWYSFTVPEPGFVTIECSGSTFDTLIALYEEGAATELIYNDDDDIIGDFLSAIRTYPVEPGTYELQVGGYFGDTGTLNMTGTLFVPVNIDLLPPVGAAKNTVLSQSKIDVDRGAWVASENSSHVFFWGTRGNDNRRFGAALGITNQATGAIDTLADIYINETDNAALFHPITPSRYYLHSERTGRRGGKMWLVEEDGDYQYFAFSTSAFYGVNGDSEAGDVLYSAGFDYPCAGIFSFRYNTVTQVIEGTQGDFFAKWDDAVFVPEADGANIIGNTPTVTSGAGGKVFPSADFFEAVHAQSVKVGDNLWAMAWFAEGQYDVTEGFSTQPYKAAMCTTWEWNSTTKRPVILTERTIHYQPGDGTVQPYGDSEPFLAPNGDIVHFWSGITSALGSSPYSVVRWTHDGTYFYRHRSSDTPNIPNAPYWGSSFSGVEMATIRMIGDTVHSVYQSQSLPEVNMQRITFENRVVTAIEEVTHVPPAGQGFNDMYNTLLADEGDRSFGQGSNFTLLDFDGAGLWSITLIDQYDDTEYVNGVFYVHAERYEYETGFDRSLWAGTLPRELPVTLGTSVTGRNLQIIDAGKSSDTAGALGFTGGVWSSPLLWWPMSDRVIENDGTYGQLNDFTDDEWWFSAGLVLSSFQFDPLETGLKSQYMKFKRLR